MKQTGGVTTNTTPPTRPKDRQTWIAEKAEEAGVRFDPSATMRVAGWLGEDIGRLDGILATLVSTYGTNRRLTASDVEPFLGEAGGVPPWDFTDAVDAGETTKALTMLGRMMGAGDRHPLVVMAVLHNHYGRLARLDGVDASSEVAAAEAMGIKPGFPATKALANYQPARGRRDPAGDPAPGPGRSRSARRTRPARRLGDGGAGGEALAPRRESSLAGLALDHDPASKRLAPPLPEPEVHL